MNLLKNFLSLHVWAAMPSIFGGILEGLFGSDIPSAPTLAQTMPSRTSSSGLLSNTSTIFNPNSKRLSNTISLTPTAQGLLSDFDARRLASEQAYQDFGIRDYADERYALMKDMLDRGDVLAGNRLMDRTAAITGGLGVTPGGRQMLSDFDQNRVYARNKVLLDLLGMGENREQNLFARSREDMGDYVGFLGGLDDQLGRDQQSYFNLAPFTQSAANVQFQQKALEAESENNFWNSLGNDITKLATKGFSNFMDTGSIFGNTGSLFGSSGLSNLSNISSSLYTPTFNPLSLGYTTPSYIQQPSYVQQPFSFSAQPGFSFSNQPSSVFGVNFGGR